MLILYLADRLSERGGADQHLLQVVGAAASWGVDTIVAVGRRERGAQLPLGTTGVIVKGLASAVATTSRLATLRELLKRADVVHVQNVMNSEALEMAVATGRALVTVQDHRVFCPGPGRTLPDGGRCRQPMGEEACATCLVDPEYRARAIELTAARRDALRGARLLVLSHYMAEELEASGLPGAEVLPPWVQVSNEPVECKEGFVLGGRLVHHKGILEAWRAWRRADTGQPLRVAGRGPLEPELAGAEVLGWLDQERLERVLRGARALLFPSFWQEPFGILGLQALAAATAVIVTDSGGTAEWSDAGCLRVPPGDTAAVTAAITRLASDPGLARRLGEEGRAMASARFVRAPIEARLRAIYEELAAGPKQPGFQS